MTSQLTAQSAERAVEALSFAVLSTVRPTWVIDHRTGIEPAALAKAVGAAVVVSARTDESIKTVGTRLSDNALNASVVALSQFVGALCAHDDND